jgi:DNA-binding PadR family transcriptional regulator
MPITSQQKKAIAYNQDKWRSAKHLESWAAKIGRSDGKVFLTKLDHAVRFKWLEEASPGWGRGVVYYRLTAKGRKYLKKHCYDKALEAFRLPEAIKLSATRADLQRQGWFSVKHVGWVDDKLIEAGYYEQAIFFRQKMNGTFFRLTAAGKVWAKQALRSRMEAELRAEFRERRAEETKMLGDKLTDPAPLIRAWDA